MQITLRITRQDLRDGKPCCAARCPTALALTRHAPGTGPGHWFVGPTDAFFMSKHNGTPSRIARLPDVGRRLVLAHDNGQKVEPCEFEVTIEEVSYGEPV